MSFNSGQLFISEPATPIDRTTMLWDGGQLSFSSTRGERGELNLELCVLPGESYEPVIGWVVQLYDPPLGETGAQRRFIGTIEDTDDGYVGDAGLHFWALSVLSPEQFYDTQPCPVISFDDGTDVADIVTALFNSVTATPFAVSIGHITGGTALDKRSYDEKTNVWSAIKQLAVDTNQICYIDPRNIAFYFVPNGYNTAPFAIQTQDLLQNGTTPLAHYKQSRSDFRNRQITPAPANILPPLNAQFDCNGLTSTFTLPAIPQQILGAALTDSVAGTATGTFTGSPANGDTITINGIVYTWRTAIDNTVPYEVLIAGTANGNAQNLAAAVNNDTSVTGTSYSFPTVQNPYVRISAPSAGVFTVRPNIMGSGGNAIALFESCTNFSWSAATITGGANALAVPLTVGVEGAGTFDLYYTPGSASIRLASTPGSGQTLTVTFSFNPLVQVGNDQASVLGLQGIAQLSTPRNVVTAAGITQQNTAIVAGFSVIPGQFEFQTFHDGLYPGDTLLVALTVPAELAAKVNGYWLIQDVRGEWIEGWENLPDDSADRHFRCTVKLINSVQFNNYQNTLQRLVDTGVNQPSLAPPEDPLTGGTDPQLVAYQWPIQIADTTVGSDKGPHISVAMPLNSLSPVQYHTAQASRLQGVLRQTLTADLTIRINCVRFASPPTTQSWEITIPAGWGVDDPIYVEIQGEINNGDVIYPDVVAGPSPVVKDANGVVAVTLVAV